MLQKLALCLLVVVGIAACSSPASATGCLLGDVTCDPQAFITLSGSGGTSFTGATTNTTLTFASGGSNNYFVNNTGQTITDFTITFVGYNNSSPTLDKFHCSTNINGSAFDDCTDQNTTAPPSFHFFLASGSTLTGIANGATFDIILDGNYLTGGASSSTFDLTPSFNEGGGGGGGGGSVPEPASLVLLGTGLLGVAGLSRRRQPRCLR